MTDRSSDTSLDIETIKNHSKNKKPSSTGFWAKLFGLETQEDDEDENFEDKIIEIIKDHDATNKLSGIEGRVLLHNILEFGALTASDVMIPRSDIVALSVDSNKDDIIKSFIKHNHSRMPIFEKDLDNVIGFVHIKDLLTLFLTDESNFNLKKIIREIIFVVPTMNIIDLLVKMRSARVHMALVLDEYGGIDGLITIDDLLEQIVGNIEEDHDIKKPEIVKVSEKVFEASARISIEKLEEVLDRNIFDGDEEDCETLAGLIFVLAGHVPSKGEIINHPLGIKFEILDADPRNVKTARIILPA
ncbi:MAG: HlyC/CorC family transporter [Sphingobacteriia bacterium]|nr:HlyC/CorC family transporter [Sphingobacteriia bacterium]